MAKTKFTGRLSDEEEKSEYESWVAGTHQKLIPLAELHEHPDNWDLVGRMDGERRRSFKEDIKKNSIREPLQVWHYEDKLIVVSGHERLSAARELGLAEVPCIKLDFKNETEVRQHIFATNKHRKQVRVPPPELMTLLFPPEEYPLMYADLRANYSYENEAGESESTSGTITPEMREEAREKRIEERRVQSELRKQAGEVTGYSEKFTSRIVKQAARKVRERGKKPEKRELSPAEENKIASLRKQLAGVRTKREKKEERFGTLKAELADLRKFEKRIEREIGKLGGVE